MTFGSKGFEIPKELVWQAYKEARANRGAPGYDGVTFAEFDKARDKNLYKIWNRLVSGAYFPPPVLEKKIPKLAGGERTLGIPTVSDRIAQGAIKIFLEAQLDPLFHPDSYGYRPGKSAHQAIEVTKRRCWQYSWILEVDIKGYFDNVRHDLVLKALKHHKVPNWVLLYCERWLQAPMITKDEIVTERTVGTPQGGVVSPLLANLVLHYAIDVWMQKAQPKNPFARYADDLVCHCKTMREAIDLKSNLQRRLAEVGLELSLEKSHVVYVDTFQRHNVPTRFTFLGYDFQLRTLKDPKGQLFRKCMPGASKKAMKRMTEIVKGWKIHRSTKETLVDFAHRYNPTVRGWIGYYGKFWYRNFGYRLWSVIQSRLLKWTCNKFRVSVREAERRLHQVQREQPKLFAHWYLLRDSNL